MGTSILNVFGTCHPHLCCSHCQNTRAEHLRSTCETEILNPRCILLRQFQHQMSVAASVVNTCDAEDKRGAGEHQALHLDASSKERYHFLGYEGPFGSCLMFNQESG